MKRLLLTLALAGTVSAQEYLLPIGENVDRREATVGIVLGSYGIRLEDTFTYEPRMGTLELVVEDHVRNLAAQFVPPIPETPDAYLYVNVDPGPYYTVEEFQLYRSGTTWLIPEEVLNVELEYGRSVGWKLQGVTAVSMQLQMEDLPVKYYSTKDGVGGDSPCEIESAQSVLTMGWATINATYGLPWLKEDWWDSGNVTIEAFDGFATFNILNGYLLEASDPPPTFLEKLRTLPVPLSPPRITSLTREGKTTTLTVAGGSNSSIVVEWKEKLGDDWQIVSYAAPLTLNSGGTGTFTHVSATPSGFYRVSAHSSAVERKAVKPASP